MKKQKKNIPLLKMKELVDITQVPKSTILLYVKQGLLPKPVKTSPNMAYYDPICKERIAFIKRIQSSHRLPLAAIKGLIKEMEKGENVDLMLELQTHIFESGKKRLKKNAFCRATGLSASDLERICRMGLILPLEDGLFNEQDKAIGIILKQCLDTGMDLIDFEFYPKLASRIVDKELNLREEFTKDMNFEANAALTLELTRMARSIRSYIIDRTMQKRLMAYKGLKE